MIISVGEILIDEILGESFPGGAPFNVAVNAKRSGADVRFFGTVGDDKEGSLLRSYVSKYGLDPNDIHVDKQRKTTKAVVFLDDKGERTFRFVRNDTADSYLPHIPEEVLIDASILHIGSLGICYGYCREYLKNLIEKAKSYAIPVSFDMNYREDIFESKEEAIALFKEFLLLSDIIKLSSDEVEILGQEFVMNELRNKIVFITYGEDGSVYKKGDVLIGRPSIMVLVKDTVGAGDAFFGSVLASLDSKETDIENVLDKANLTARESLRHEGALPKV